MRSSAEPLKTPGLKGKNDPLFVGIPIMRLPDEIFLVCFEEIINLWADSRGDITSTLLPLGSCTHPSIVLSHVSRHWRHLTLNTPSLWTEICIHVHNMACKRDSAALSIVFADVIHRSKDMQIRVELKPARCCRHTSGMISLTRSLPVSRHQERNSFGHACEPALNALLPSLHRIRSLAALNSSITFSAMLSRIFVTAAMTPESSFSSLIELTVANHDSPNTQHNGQTLRPIPSRLFLSLLASAPRLKSLSLVGNIVDFARPNTPLLTLPSLKYLLISKPVSTYRTPLNFLSTICAPALHHLELRESTLLWTKDVIDALFADQSPNFLSNSIASLPTSKFPNVEDLTFHRVSFQGSERVRTFVQAFPRVKRLVLDAPTLEEVVPAFALESRLQDASSSDVTSGVMEGWRELLRTSRLASK
ncbi:hypothetical protein BJ138DRAFT_787557 [Hygrophoropsis aurantiaca]|uniref:Uncharacterized protein n=1 Tax=Hygrophoropsis aurantiaca TaxID=72124 RepID=A0ACB7ZVT2_9AGAM|nr:hypothetical protein BJ138DRAFT_787557 [Hygrophoropsis aurantiaca]